MRITHDIHTHSTLSHCCYDPAASIANMVRRAAELGHKIFGISNHLWDEKVPGASKWYKNQMISYGLEARNSVPADTCGVRVLIGVETEYFATSDTLGMLAETAGQFDYALIPHSHIHMRGDVMPDSADVVAIKQIFQERIAKALTELSADQVRRMANALGYAELDTLAAAGVFFPPTVDFAQYCAEAMLASFAALMANPEFIKLAAAVPTSVAHPFAPCGLPSEIYRRVINLLPDDKLTECFRSAKALGVAIEINTGAFKFPEDDWAHDPLIRVMKLAKAAGCKFTFGTDAHSLAGLDKIRRADDISRVVGITEDDLAGFVK